jgi:hypothetical protein
MPDSVRRRGGDDDTDAWRARRLHSLSQEEIEHFVSQVKGGNGTGSALSISWGNKSLAAKGAAAITAIMFVSIVSAILYAGFRVEGAINRVEQAAKTDHDAIRKSQDRLSCMVALSPDERTTFRNEYRPGAWNRWCGWMDNEH